MNTKQIDVAAIKTLVLDGDKLINDAAEAFIQGDGPGAALERSLAEGFGHELLRQIELAAERQVAAANTSTTHPAK